jgi:hypothetical protein
MWMTWLAHHLPRRFLVRPVPRNVHYVMGMVSGHHTSYWAAPDQKILWLERFLQVFRLDSLGVFTGFWVGEVSFLKLCTNIL